MSRPNDASTAGAGGTSTGGSGEASLVSRAGELWPSLPFEAWRNTCATLHMWFQIVGKTRLAASPMWNHWWQVSFYLTLRGLTTSPLFWSGRTFDVDFDFLDHRLFVRTSEGATRSLALAPRTVADFYREYVSTLRELGLDVHIRPVPVEIPVAIPFESDREHQDYDPEYATRYWRVLLQADRVLKTFRGRFLGKCSPVHFFWGAPDLAVTRFSGRPAPPHPGGAPNVGNWVMREAYSHEVSSAGFWAGGDALPEPVFYSYSYPEPEGYASAPAGPKGAYYHPEMREFLLPYEIVRAAPSPDDVLLEFLQATYEAAADLGRWDRAALERGPGR